MLFIRDSENIRIHDDDYNLKNTCMTRTNSNKKKILHNNSFFFYVEYSRFVFVSNYGQVT